MPRVFLVFIIDFIYFILYIKMFNGAITNKTITNKPITNKPINNILSYFIKDSKDPFKLTFYKQNNSIYFFNKNELLYRIRYYHLKSDITVWKYKNNIMIDYYIGRIKNYKIDSLKQSKQKILYYKKDENLRRSNYNYIFYEYIYTKYLQKIRYNYVIENECLLSIEIKYYNRYKYINNYKNRYRYCIYKHDHIFIMNKYELYYNNQFVNIFFGNN
jgi:hypothetical protein